MKPMKPPTTKSPGALWLKREAELVEALCIATTQMRDLCNGWPVDELCERPIETMKRLDRLVPGHEVRPL